MATGAPGTNGVWQYGEDDSEATFSALLNKVASTTNTQIGADRARLAILEQTGRVVQVVYGNTVTETTISTSTPTDTTLTATITPKYASSKILVIVNQLIQEVSLTNSYVAGMRILRNGNDLGAQYMTANAGVGAGGALAFQNSTGMIQLDSPSTTSATTYKTQAWISSGLRVVCQSGSIRSTITLIEVTA